MKITWILYIKNKATVVYTTSGARVEHMCKFGSENKIYVPDKNVYVCFFVNFEISAASIFIQWPNFFVSNVNITRYNFNHQKYNEQVCNLYYILYNLFWIKRTERFGLSLLYQ